MISPFTASVDDLQNRLMYTAAHGMTALFDGVYLGLSQMKGAHNTKKALLIISDGGDNHSRYSETEIRKFVQEADVQIYAIGLFEPDGGPTPEEREGPGLLGDLTEMTGGRTFAVQNLNDLPDIATKISMELRNQYVLGYRPSHARTMASGAKLRSSSTRPRVCLRSPFPPGAGISRRATERSSRSSSLAAFLCCAALVRAVRDAGAESAAASLPSSAYRLRRRTPGQQPTRATTLKAERRSWLCCT